MKIFLDESGTFSAADTAGAFCVVAAYVMPECAWVDVQAVLNQFKAEAGFLRNTEVKRKNASEAVYFRFLQRLGRLPGIVVAVATDAAYNEAASRHQEEQAGEIAESEPSMIYPEGKAAIRKLAADLRSLSTQNYVELMCRTHLAWNVIKTGSLYFVQRIPETLSSFEWRFDQKDISRTRFESTFKNVSIALMQTMSFRDPIRCLEGADYSDFDSQFAWQAGAPAWLPPVEAERGLVDAGKIWREKHEFLDSKTDVGIQVADLVVSGIYGCLRGRFANNDMAACLLGHLMVSPPKGKQAIQLIGLTDRPTDSAVARDVARSVIIMNKTSRPMVLGGA